jgi:hypothetical protein
MSDEDIPADKMAPKGEAGFLRAVSRLPRKKDTPRRNIQLEM